MNHIDGTCRTCTTRAEQYLRKNNDGGPAGRFWVLKRSLLSGELERSVARTATVQKLIFRSPLRKSEIATWAKFKLRVVPNILTWIGVLLQMKWFTDLVWLLRIMRVFIIAVTSSMILGLTTKGTTAMERRELYLGTEDKWRFLYKEASLPITLFMTKNGSQISAWIVTIFFERSLHEEVQRTSTLHNFIKHISNFIKIHFFSLPSSWNIAVLSYWRPLGAVRKYTN